MGLGSISPGESTGVGIPLEEQREQLGKVLHSEVFRGAPGLQRFLEYIASKTIDGFSDEIKEYTIGKELLGRTEDYDPRVDTVVRVQARRLREKLKEYYDCEGAQDDILLAIPKGHYVPCFSRRPPSVPPNGESQASSEQLPEQHIRDDAEHGKHAAESEHPPLPKSRGRSALLFVAGFAALPLLATLVLTLNRPAVARLLQQAASTLSNGASAEAPSDVPLSALWADFLRPDSSPIVAYSNDVFLATQTSDLLRVQSDAVDDMGAPANSALASRLVANPDLLQKAGPVFFEDVYTGTGEVMAVFYLTRTFGNLHSGFGVKRSRLVTIDDLNRHDLIFLGSTKENALLAGLPLPQDFVFEWPAQNPGVWTGRIVNLNTQSGEQGAYAVERDYKTGVVHTDYALVSFLPGFAPNRKIVVLGGLTTLGTQAAAEYVSSPSSVAELISRLAGKPGADDAPAYFQAVLKVEIMRGDVLSVSYVTGHRIRRNSRAGTP
jgi:hypothetical protein